MGLSNLVYPGAQHTRFHHALGCVYLMQKAIHTLRLKGTDISREEEQGLLLAILLHDIGHGPFSHALEGFFIPNVSHEQLSLALMKQLNSDFKGQLSLAIAIFENKYHRKFFYQLISSQLDMDRLDYLNRDSFYTGVVEGSINSDRLIAMLQVHQDTLVVEEKGIYSIEKFLLSRRFMYWQVYLHKTGLIAEKMLLKIVERARELSDSLVHLPISSALHKLLNTNSTVTIDEKLAYFLQVDDNDIWHALKVWQDHEDVVLSQLSTSILHRRLPKMIMSTHSFSEGYIQNIEKKTQHEFGINKKLLPYFVLSGSVKHVAYNPKYGAIQVLMKNGEMKDWLAIEGHFNSDSFTQIIEKHYIGFPKKISSNLS